MTEEAKENLHVLPLLGCIVEAKMLLLISPLLHSNLNDEIGSKELTLHQRLQIAYDVAVGLSFMHAAHILHRDVKPANVLV